MLPRNYRVINFLNNLHSEIFTKRTFKIFSSARSVKASTSNSDETTTDEYESEEESVRDDVKRRVSKVMGENSLTGLNSFFVPRQPSYVSYAFVWNNEVAKKIVDEILQDDKGRNCEVIEGNPGFGLITINLLKSGVKKVHIFDKKFAGVKLWKKYSNKCDLYEYKLFHGNTFKLKPVLNILKEASNSRKKCKIVGVVPGNKYLNSLPHQILDYNVWNIINMTEFNLVVTERTLKSIAEGEKSSGKYISHCLFHNLFKVEVMGEFPSSEFLPVFQTKGKMFLVKLEKKSIGFLSSNEQMLPEYVTFLNVIGRSKFNRIIDTLEKWVPGCGIYFISKGICLTTQTADLSPDESVKLFRIFTECEGYENFKILHESLVEESGDRKV